MKKFSLWNEVGKYGLLDPALKNTKNIKYYIAQPILCAIFLGLTLPLLNDFVSLSSQVIFAATGSTAFVVFATPSRRSAMPRAIIGSHAIATLCGILFWFLRNNYGYLISNDHTFLLIIGLASAVGLTTFFLVIFDTEHPPAAGTALAFSIFETTNIESSVMYIMICAITLSLLRQIAWKAKLLKDLI